MKIMLCILTSSCTTRLARLVNNLKEIRPVKGVTLSPVIVVNCLKDSYFQEVLKLEIPLPVVRTESNGKPGKGKNSCLDLFLSSDCDFISQIDGDDILYPTYLESLADHIKRVPNIDVLGTIPIDVLDRDPNIKGHLISLNKGFYAGVWGISLVPAHNGTAGPGEAKMFSEDLPNSVDFIILQSKKSALIKMDENIAVGEDHLYSYQLLAEHQKGNLSYYHTMSSDLFLVDKTTEVSVQKTFPQIYSVDELKEKTLKYVKRERSSLLELPIIYKDLLLDQYSKEKWIRSFL